MTLLILLAASIRLVGAQIYGYLPIIDAVPIMNNINYANHLTSVDSSANKGTYSNFTSYQYGPPTTIVLDLNMTGNGQYYPNTTILNIFSQILNRTKIIIHVGSNIIIRDLREQPYSEGLQFVPQSGLPWIGAFIRCDDADKPELVDLKADIIFAMYYSPHNSDDVSNHWGDVPVVVVDGAMFGAYPKDLTVDGKIVFTYKPGSGSFWLQYNLQTGEAKVFI